MGGWISGLVRTAQPRVELRMNMEELALLIGGEKTATGRVVSTEGALSQVTLFACVRLISEAVAMLPLILYRRLERGKERASDHPLYGVLHDLPNPEQTALELYENMVGHLGLWGNSYCEIEYDGAGRRRALWPLRPDRMTVGVEENSNQRVYDYLLPDGKTVRLPRYRVWHVRGWGTDPWTGKSPVALAREAIGLALATEGYGARFFGNDSRPGGVLKTPNKLSNEAAVKLKERWEQAHKGLSNAQRIAVLEDGLEWQQIGVPPEEAQFLETRQFQDTQICMIYRVPPHMIGITERSTSWGTGIEQQALGFVGFTLMPYLQRITQSISRDLLLPSERRDLFAEHLTAALVRGDLAARYSAYNIGRNGGWLSVNDIREMENMNPVDEGDGYLQPLNMAPLGEEPEPEPDQNDEPDQEDDDEQEN